MLIYAHNITNRLRYSASFLLGDLMGMQVKFTNDAEAFYQYKYPKINYSSEDLPDCFHLQPSGLLFETTITEQQIKCFIFNDRKAFFKCSKGDFPFDIFSSAFYLLSRYEEYLPHVPDQYGRFDHHHALAFKEGFLDIPIINYWAKDLSRELQKKYPSLKIQENAFSLLPTYDIDIAWSVKHKGFARQAAAAIKNPVSTLAVLLGLKKDPFDVYDGLAEFYSRSNLKPYFFFLVARELSRYDRNILPSCLAMQTIIKKHQGFAIGLHPSWRSNFLADEIINEKKLLEDIIGLTINASRQHYIRLSLPDTYKNLLAAGITHDYSMGYGSINGFRASVASSFLWYDLSEEETTDLCIHPFCFMDANSFYEQSQNIEESRAELFKYYKVCNEAGGTMIVIFHNNFLGPDKKYKGWKKLHDDFILQFRQ